MHKDTDMTNGDIKTPTLDNPVHVVTRIGRGVKLHLSFDTGYSRLYPACGGDSPYSLARNTGHALTRITCAKCLARAKALGLLPL